MTDPAEEYFRALESLTPDTAEWRVKIATARNNYRMNSRYTPEYCKQREEYLRAQALKRFEAKGMGDDYTQSLKALEEIPSTQQSSEEVMDKYRYKGKSWYRPIQPRVSLRDRIKKLFRG